MLGYAESLERVVVRFLTGFRINMDPTGIASAHGIRVIAVDIEWG
jgi:hypothetical protein